MGYIGSYNIGVPTNMSSELLRQALMDADEQGYRLEIIDGLGVWEVMPSRRHIDAEARIERSVRPDPAKADPSCGCHVYRDLYVRFADGSLRRPDVAIYCQVPQELDEAVTLVPAAVVEIVSAGSERKDLELSPPFYRRHGIEDVVVLDPYSGIVWHHTTVGVARYQSPVDIALQCGCLVTV
jgi:Uma2 family endonuclease